MPSLYDVPSNDLIKRLAAELKKTPEIKAPAWSVYAKTGMHKERPPRLPDWWHVRAAAVLRSIAKLGPVGVSKLRTKYGGKKNRGHKPGRFYKGSGNIIRKILQQLESAKLIKQTKIGVHKGRVLTPAGQSLLDKTALAMYKEGRKTTKQEPKQEQDTPVAPAVAAKDAPATK